MEYMNFVILPRHWDHNIIVFALISLVMCLKAFGP